MQSEAQDGNGVTEQKQTNNKTNTNDKLPKKDRLKLTFRNPKNWSMVIGTA